MAAKVSAQNSIKPSRRLHGKAGDIDPTSVSSRMEELRTIMTNFEPKNIYKEDETGLLYRMIPTRTYMAAEEEAHDTRGTSCMRRKERITAVFCANADGSHKIPLT